MRLMDDPRKSALIWSALGVVTAPSFLFAWVGARLQNFVPDSDRYVVAYLLGYVVLLVLAIRGFRRAVNFGRRDFDWSHHAGRMFTVFTVIFVLEVVTQVTWNLSDFLSGIADRLNIYEFPIFLGGFAYFVSLEEIATIAILILTLPLALRLLDAYFDFLNGWIAAVLEVFQAGSAPQGEEAPSTSATSPSSQTKHTIEDFESTAIAAITRADLKSYAGMAGIVLSVALAIIGFIYVFQTSATTRATQIVDSIERTPIAFSGKFFDVARDLQEISEKLAQISPPVIVVDPVGSVSNDEQNGSSQKNLEKRVFITAQGQSVNINNYLLDLIKELQDVGDREDTLTAEGEAFLAQLRSLRKEISDTSRTNWETILLRTAIIVMALVAVKIFHSVMMAASRERFSWENKLAAMRALRDGTLASEQVEQFLALQSEGCANSADGASNPLPVDLDKLVEKFAEHLKKG